MAFRLHADRAIGSDLRRLFDAELDAAITGLSSPAAANSHDVRKHIKKARALLFAGAAPSRTDDGETDGELRIANRALGGLADAGRLVETVDLLDGLEAPMLSSAAVTRMRCGLIRRARAIEEMSIRNGTRARIARLLISARQRSPGWSAGHPDTAALIAAIREAHHMAADLRKLVRERPTIASYHRWRRRVKLEWYLVRLITDHTGDRLRDDRHRLAALDACLGELHDLNVLAAALAGESILERRDTAGALRAIRALAAERRRRAGELSVVLKDRPRDVARRLEALWGCRPRDEQEGACPATV